MTAPTTTQLRKTALNSVHRRMGAKMVNFGGWDMPVEYSGIVSEHMATRTAAGLFDVSHMGEIEVRGPHALELVQHVTCNDAAKLVDGQAQYSGLMTSAGTFVDDLLVHRIGAEHYLLCVNASHQDQDFDYIGDENFGPGQGKFGFGQSSSAPDQNATGLGPIQGGLQVQPAPVRGQKRVGAEIENAGERYSQIAIQGPKALGILERLTKAPVGALKYYRFTFGEVDGIHCMIARTGYTGEDGFEIYFSPEHSERLWIDLLDAGGPDGLLPCGLGARNTLRLEAGMCLYGNEIDQTTTVWEANLGWICKMDKGDFLGREALAAQRQNGIRRILVGFEMQDRLIARDCCAVWIGGREAGRVTSGSPAPFLKKNIGMAYVPVESSAVGTEIAIAVRAHQAPAQIAGLPFYKRGK